MTHTQPLSGDTHGVSRRSVLGYGAALVGGAGLGAAGQAVGSRGGTGVGGATDNVPVEVFTHTVPFFGPHQAGVATPPQAHATFVAVDLLPGSGPKELRRLLTLWTDDAARLTQGKPTLADPQPDLAAPPAGLTVTVGVGPGAVTAAGKTGPSWLRPLPAFTIDRLTPAYSDGDLFVQVCGDDPTVVAHAVRAMLIDTTGLATRRWVQRGFRRPAGSASVMRNLMGQVDGTINPAPTEPDFDDLVWVGSDGPEWLRGGSGVVVRRIAMDLDRWDLIDRRAKEETIGRTLADGTPLSGGAPADKVDLTSLDAVGLTKIPMFSHVRHAAAQGARDRFLRRPYSYDEPPTDPRASADAGLLFVTFQSDVDEQFVPVQKRLDGPDLLNTWTTPVGSAVFAVLPGCAEGELLGQTLLA